MNIFARETEREREQFRATLKILFDEFLMPYAKEEIHRIIAAQVSQQLVAKREEFIDLAVSHINLQNTFRGAK